MPFTASVPVSSFCTPSFYYILLTLYYILLTLEKVGVSLRDVNLGEGETIYCMAVVERRL